MDAARIRYRLGNDLDPDTVIDVYRASSLGERRPVEDRARMAGMLHHANLVVSAWNGDELVGVARSLSDLCYVTYLADLAVRGSHQRRGIGRELIAAWALRSPAPPALRRDGAGVRQSELSRQLPIYAGLLALLVLGTRARDGETVASQTVAGARRLHDGPPLRRTRPEAPTPSGSAHRQTVPHRGRQARAPCQAMPTALPARR